MWSGGWGLGRRIEELEALVAQLEHMLKIRDKEIGLPTAAPPHLADTKRPSRRSPGRCPADAAA